jgi:methylthioribulose-1-phosphate dehydratase
LSSFKSEDMEQMDLLAQLIRQLNQRGHSPATSGNYSLRSLTNSDKIIISESGIDKQNFLVENFVSINKAGELDSAFSSRKSSDETDLHLMIYDKSKAGCVLHSHHLNSVLFADIFSGKDIAWLEDLELLKGLAGVDTHEARVPLPIFDNSQNISVLVKEISPIFEKHQALQGFLLRGHGLTCWGKDLHEAKRHLEVFEYIFSYYLERRV